MQEVYVVIAHVGTYESYPRILCYKNTREEAHELVLFLNQEFTELERKFAVWYEQNPEPPWPVHASDEWNHIDDAHLLTLNEYRDRTDQELAAMASSYSCKELVTSFTEGSLERLNFTYCTATTEPRWTDG